MNTVMHFDADPEADPADLLNPADVAEQILTLLAGRVPAEDRVEARNLQ